MPEQSRRSTPDAQRETADELSRHISIRLPAELYRQLELLAADGNESVSRAARRLLSEGLEPPRQQAIDQVISTLLLVRGQLQGRSAPESAAPSPAVSEPPRSARTVDLFNAKTDLQHLIDDVARGDEIVITYAGTRRARLVPVNRP